MPLMLNPFTSHSFFIPFNPGIGSYVCYIAQGGVPQQYHGTLILNKAEISSKLLSNLKLAF
jgi:hypothetical protein